MGKGGDGQGWMQRTQARVDTGKGGCRGRRRGCTRGYEFGCKCGFKGIRGVDEDNSMRNDMVKSRGMAVNASVKAGVRGIMRRYSKGGEGSPG